MGIVDILQQYAVRPTDTHTDFDEVAREVPQDVLGDGMAHALKSDQTPASGELAGRLFGGSDPQQRAGLIDAQHPEVFKALGGTVLAIALGQMAQRMKR